jgi:hypothetical protein
MWSKVTENVSPRLVLPMAGLMHAASHILTLPRRMATSKRSLPMSETPSFNLILGPIIVTSIKSTYKAMQL